MGHNAAILIRNADLRLIENDTKFGEKVASAIRGADVVLSVARDYTRKRTVLLSEVNSLHNEPSPEYEIQSTSPEHADAEQIFLVENGRLLTVRQYGEPMGFAEWERVAVKAKEFGIESKIGPFDSRKLPEAPSRTESEVMRGWADEEFDSGVTSISVLIDGLDSIQKDPNFGEKTADAIRKVWATERRLTDEWAEAEEDGDPGQVRGYMSRDIGSRWHGNAASVIATTLPGETDIVIVGGNWGRALRADKPIEHKVSGRDDLFDDLRQRDLDTVAQALRAAGFSVKEPDEDRMRAPSSWQKDGFITNFDKPEEDDDRPSM